MGEDKPLHAHLRLQQSAVYWGGSTLKGKNAKTAFKYEAK
jgi:hypothetical protein